MGRESHAALYAAAIDVRCISLQRLPFPSLAVLVIFLAAALPGPAHCADAQTQSPALTVSLVSPAIREWPETVPASGWLKPWREAIIASEIGGLRITEILAEVGAVVTKGDPLVRLAQDEVFAELHKQEAAVESAQADLDKAKTNATRVRKLTGNGVLTQEKTLEYLAAEQTAAASLKSAEAMLESQKIKVEQTTIRAVDDGLITSRTAQLGAVVSSGSELYRLVQQQRVEWQAEVAAQYLPRIRQGLKVNISGPGGSPIEGTVRLVGPTVNADTGRALVYVELPAKPRPPIGVYVTGEIQLNMSSALAVPESSLVFRDGLTYVYVVGDDLRASRVRVGTGRRSGNEVEIISGLERSAKVVKSGGAFLSDNALVSLEVKTQ
ncbi:efflux RND transporter periplasmic adaptor subunit [Aestuariivirga sp.]|uniref:efflux RND transporter periplasmic adaptor subunit n=1 Tax=Aestuariivirga sp. TaxID=2650926 RepID=UPI003BAD8F55